MLTFGLSPLWGSQYGQENLREVFKGDFGEVEKPSKKLLSLIFF